MSKTKRRLKKTCLYH